LFAADVVSEALDDPSDQDASCLRPFALLLLMVAWPARVFMRVKNPWVRARLVVLG